MPLVYTGSPDVVADLMKVYRGGLPADVASPDRVGEDAEAFATVFAYADGEFLGWAREARVSTSHGPWTDAHARDRGEARAVDETDDVLQGRLVSPPDAVTPGALLDAIQALVDLAGGGQAFLIEVPIDEATVVRASGDPNPSLSFIGRAGCRVAGARGTIIARIPAGLGLLDAITALLRKRRAAGKRYLVEEYATP